jgi:hypothetical protein
MIQGLRGETFNDSPKQLIQPAAAGMVGLGRWSSALPFQVR